MTLIRRSALALALSIPFAVPAVADDAKPQETAVANRIVVELKLKGGYDEDPKPSNPFGPQQRNFRGLLLKLRKLAADPEVIGVKLAVDDVPDYARSIDLLDELRAVKKAGKKVVCYAENLTQRSLMFASLGDVLMLPPSGAVVLEGLVVEAMYMKDLLALLDVQIKVVHIGDYKTAFEDLARDSMSKEQREVIDHLLDEYWNQMLDTIAANRGVGRDKVEAAFDKVFLTPTAAKDLGIVSDVGYEDEFDAACESLFGKDAKVEEKYGDKDGSEELEKALESPFAAFTLIPKLLNPPKQKFADEPRIAIVYATGGITSGKSEMGFDGTVSSMGSETIVEALEKALKDDWVRAVVLRVNSPGGSALASDMIWRATQRVKAKKPIVASMGGVAGSGGYWISMGCDRIVAQPSTITGSIGVVSMLPDVSKLLTRFGIKVEVVGKGPHVEDLAILKNGPTPQLEAIVRGTMLEVYGEFIRKVSEGRKLPKATVEALAKGRVWTGRQALENGLVDRLGGLDESIALACELAGKLDPKAVTIAEYPEAPSLGETIERLFEDMTLVEAPARALLAKLGFDTAVAQLDLLVRSLDGASAIDPHAVQAIMPLFTAVR